MPAPLRGTQSLVGQMGWVSNRPLLVALEIAWRWLFGIPFLLVCGRQFQQIFAAYPLESSGFNSIDSQNPWLAVVQIINVWAYYLPHLLAVSHWLLPLAALAWVAVSGLGRGFLLTRIPANPGRTLPFRPVTMMVLQAAWLALLAAVFWAWFRSIQWVAATHIGNTSEPDLVGYSIWVICLSLAWFTAWALLSWVFSMAPLLALLEGCNPVAALGRSLCLGREFSSKLAETNLVMGIVKLMLIVLAMVFSAAPLPFSDELGSDALRVVWAASIVFYLVANDYFHLVRLKGFIEFWRIYRGR
jgi:hypothetical protein